MRKQRELLGQRGRNDGRHPETLPTSSSACGRERGVALERPGELLEVERVAAALVVQGGCGLRRRRLRRGARRPRRSSAPPSSTRVRVPLRRAGSSAAVSRSGTCRGRTASAISTAASGGRRSSEPRARPRPGRPSGRRRARAPAVRRRRAARAAHAPRGGCGSARAEGSPGRPRVRRATGRRCERAASPASSASRRRGSRPRRYSSRASTNTQNGRSRSSSEAAAREHEVPARVARAIELGEQPGLADPGLADQLERGGPPRRARRAARSSSPSSSARPTRCSASRPFRVCTSIDQGRRIEKSGCRPDVGRSRRASGSLVARYLLHHRHEPHECGVVVRVVQGHESPLRRQAALASCRSGGHAIWWTVEAAIRGRGTRAAPVLRRRAHHGRKASTKSRSRDGQSRTDPSQNS